MSDSPFLTVVTRHLALRGHFLAANRASLSNQTDQDFEQVLILDREGRGKRAAAASLRAEADRYRGEYVYILDDDDLLTDAAFVAGLKRIAAESDPDAIIVRARYGPLGILPDAPHWGARPVLGRIGAISFAVRRAVWCAHAAVWGGQERLIAGRTWGRCDDGVFIQSIWDAGATFYWWDNVIAATQQIGALAGVT